MKNSASANWDVKYEWKTVLLLSLGFALVGLDRFMILPMFPSMMSDLQLNYQHLGLIVGALSVAWGIAALFAGNAADRIGHKKVIVVGLVVFSLLAGVSGLAIGLGSIVMIRALIGFSEGTFVPAGIFANISASKPTRHGRNIGIMQAMIPLVGLGFAPIIVTQLLQVVNWRWIFTLVILPGFLVAYLAHKLIRNPTAAERALHTTVADTAQHKWSDVFAYGNIRICMIGMMCWLVTLIAFAAFLPSYLTDHLKLSLEQMGIVLSSIGFGAGVGSILMAMLADRIGRKPVMIINVVGTIIFVWLLSQADANVSKLFALLFMASFFNASLTVLTTGALPAESVPPALMATAAGIVIGAGEIFGGGIAPIIVGISAEKLGIGVIFDVAIIGMVIGLVAVCFLKETLPTRQK